MIEQLLVPFEPGDVAVASLVIDARGPDLRLRHGSILVGPEQMGRMGWPEWVAEHSLHPPPFSAPARVEAESGGVILLRVAVDIEEARAWVSKLLQAGAAPRTGALPFVVAAVSSPSAPVRVFPHAETPLERLCARACRPVRGAHLAVENAPEPFSVDAGFSDDPILRPYFAQWAIGVTGTGLDDGWDSDRAPGGLLVGHLERRAWLDDVRGGKELETFDLHIGLDAHLLHPTELVVELEEFLDDELVYSRTMRLDETTLPQMTADRRQWMVSSLPTLGVGVSRRVALRHIDGELLDRTGTFNIIERVTTSVHVAGPGQSLHEAPLAFERTTGLDPAPQGGFSRQPDIDRVISQYEQLLSEGLGNVIVSGDRDAVIQRLRSELTRARSELLIVDRYFASSSTGWEVLEDLSVPVRLITTVRDASNPTLQTSPPPTGLPAIQVRGWQPRPAPPFHDRLYLWMRGGLVVGQSPNGFGGATFRLQRISAAEAARWMTLAESWWTDGRAIDVPVG